jgi:hypothetical protein
MKKAFKFLDGWHLLIAGFVLFGVAIYDAATGGHSSGLVTAGLSALGWMPAQWDTESVTKAAASAIAVWGTIKTIWTAAKQSRAGASPAALLTPEGFAVKHEVDLAEGKPAAVAVEAKAVEAVAVKVEEAVAAKMEDKQ